MKIIIAVLVASVMIAALFVPFTLAENEKETEICTAWGDMDNDQSTTPADARLALRQSVGLEDYPEDALYRCDMDKDGNITPADARFILRLSVNLEQYPAHELLPVVGRDATCTEDGLTDGLYCAICEKEFEPQQVIPAPGHKEVTDEAVAATCTEDGLTEGKHCEVCGEVFTEQETVPALGHAPVAVPAASDDVCQEAQVCDRCGLELSPELKHDIPANATVTAEKGIVCNRCGKATVPSFNELVNVLKQEPHIFRSFSRTDTSISDPQFTGVMLLFKSAFEEEFKNNNMDNKTDYSSLSEKTAVNSDTFDVIDSDAVSLLTDGDLQSSKTETVSGIGFLKNLPDTFTGQYGRISDLREIKAKEFGDVLKVTVTVKPERYSELKDKGGVDRIGRISTEFGDLISSAMGEFSSLNEDFLKSECDSVSTATVTYYFDKETMAPITAEYNLKMDMDESMNLYITQTGEQSNRSTGSISFKVTTDIHTYFFFDGYFD